MSRLLLESSGLVDDLELSHDASVTDRQRDRERTAVVKVKSF